MKYIIHIADGCGVILFRGDFIFESLINKGLIWWQEYSERWVFFENDMNKIEKYTNGINNL